MVNFGGNHLQKGPSRQTFFAKGAERVRAISLGGGFKRGGGSNSGKSGEQSRVSRQALWGGCHVAFSRSYAAPL